MTVMPVYKRLMDRVQLSSVYRYMWLSSADSVMGPTEYVLALIAMMDYHFDTGGGRDWA